MELFKWLYDRLHYGEFNVVDSLAFAAPYPHFATIVNFLIEKDHPDLDYDTILLMAVSWGQCDVVERLFKKLGPDILPVGLLDIAIDIRDVEMIRLLVSLKSSLLDVEAYFMSITRKYPPLDELMATYKDRFDPLIVAELMKTHVDDSIDSVMNDFMTKMKRKIDYKSIELAFINGYPIDFVHHLALTLNCPSTAEGGEACVRFQSDEGIKQYFDHCGIDQAYMHKIRLLAYELGKPEAAAYLKTRVEAGYAEDWKAFDNLAAIASGLPLDENLDIAGEPNEEITDDIEDEAEYDTL